MNIFIGGVQGIGKTTIALKNSIFVDIDRYIDCYLVFNKKKQNLLDLLNINNNIILFNFNKKNFPLLKDKKNFFILDVSKVKNDIIKRLYNREKNRKDFYSLVEALKDYIKFVDSLDFQNKIIINNINELNNLENLLISKYIELKKQEG